MDITNLRPLAARARPRTVEGPQCVLGWRSCAGLCIAVGSVCLLQAGILAQEAPPTLQFSFSNPGARSLGFGGAFAALADDATAAFANPAGLVQLTRPEVSVEGRHWSYATPFTEGGRLSGQPTGILLDDSPGLRIAESSEDLSGISFVSFVYPGKDWSLAFYRHQLANFEVAGENQGFFGELAPPFTGTQRFDDRRSSTHLEVVNHGVSAAYRPTENLSFGLGLSYFDGELTSNVGLFPPSAVNLPDGLFGPNSYSSQGGEVFSSVTIDDSDVGFSAGFLWHISRQWSWGGFYRQGPEFELQVDVRAGPAFDPGVPEGTLLLDVTSPMDFPDVFGTGIVFRSKNDARILSIEWDRVEYSTILDSLDDDQVGPVEIALDDGDEFHVGFEQTFVESRPIVALRVGAWIDPDHQIRFVGDDPLQEALLRSGDDELHYAVGLGVAFQSYQIDLGIDVSDLVDTVSLSAIFSF